LVGAALNHLRARQIDAGAANLGVILTAINKQSLTLPVSVNVLQEDYRIPSHDGPPHAIVAFAAGVFGFRKLEICATVPRFAESTLKVASQ